MNRREAIAALVALPGLTHASIVTLQPTDVIVVAYYERAIRNRWMRPSEVRLLENLNPDPELDRVPLVPLREEHDS